MTNDELQRINNIGFPWIIVNKTDSNDYLTFLCLPSAIREKEFLEEQGENYEIINTCLSK